MRPDRGAWAPDDFGFECILYVNWLRADQCVQTGSGGLFITLCSIATGL